MDRDFNGNKDFNNNLNNNFNNGFIPPYMDYMSSNFNGQIDFSEIYKDPFLNPMMQYEQACSYYRYLCLQMDYKIKCKEYETLCKKVNPNISNNPRDRKVE